MLAAACGMVLCAGSASAHEHEGKRSEHLTKELKLTDQQRAQVDQIGQEYQAKREQIWKQIEAINDEENAKIRALLTPEQQQKYDEEVKAWKEKKAKRHEADKDDDDDDDAKEHKQDKKASN